MDTAIINLAYENYQNCERAFVGVSYSKRLVQTKKVSDHGIQGKLWKKSNLNTRLKRVVARVIARVYETGMGLGLRMTGNLGAE